MKTLKTIVHVWLEVEHDEASDPADVAARLARAVSRTASGIDVNEEELLFDIPMHGVKVIGSSAKVKSLLAETLAAIAESNTALHELWSEAVGTQGYDKARWTRLSSALLRLQRAAATAAGHPATEPIL